MFWNEIPSDRLFGTEIGNNLVGVLFFEKSIQFTAAVDDRRMNPLTVRELDQAHAYWITTSQHDHFSKEINRIKQDKPVSKSSSLRSLHPFIDHAGILRVGGRQQNSKQGYDQQHPIILHGKHVISKLIVSAEHLRLLHAGPLIMAASLGRRFHFLGGRRVT